MVFGVLIAFSDKNHVSCKKCVYYFTQGTATSLTSTPFKT